MNARFEHSKPTRVVALEGIFVLDKKGEYILEREEEETKWPLWKGLVPITLGAFDLLAWGAWWLFA
jgi:hypothetical protein